MYKLCKSEQSALRQRQMEQQLLKMMETVRFEDITVSDLCIQAGLTRKAFYRYFSGKEGALYALVDHALWEMESLPFTEQGDLSANREKMTLFFRFWKEQKPLLDALEYSDINGVLVKRMLQYCTSDVSFMRRFLAYADKDEQEYAITYGISGIIAMILRWHRSDFRQSPEQMADMVIKLMTSSIVRIEDN